MLQVLSSSGSGTSISITASPMATSESGYSVRISEISYEMLVPDSDFSHSFDKEGSTISTSRPVEKCHCPDGYIGASCQECADGFYHHDTSNNQFGTVTKICVRCECNGHSTMCNKRTGECVNCQGNTIGGQCQYCQDGFYGNGTVFSGGCKKCPCKRPNTVTPLCEMHQSDLGFNVTCLNCSLGYTGDLCTRCNLGYFSRQGGL